MFRVSKKHEILLYPACTLLLGTVAFNTEVRVVVQSLLMLAGINELLFGYTLIKNNFLAENEAAIPEPVQEVPTYPEGFKPLIRVDGQAHYAFNTQKVEISNERRMAVILLRWRENERPINLTEEYWVLQKKFFTRKKFARDIMYRWDRNSITYRVNANKNASRDIHDWKRVEAIAHGAPLPH